MSYLTFRITKREYNDGNVRYAVEKKLTSETDDAFKSIVTVATLQEARDIIKERETKVPKNVTVVQ